MRIDVADGHGSGVVFAVSDSAAYIYTNEHVVGRERMVDVNLWNTDEWDFLGPYDGRVLGSHEDSDLAIVQVQCRPCSAFSPVPFGERWDYPAGSEVYAIGYPYGTRIYPSLTGGIISSWAVWIRTEVNILHIDSPINPGNSGGPIVSARDGRIVGLVTSKNVGIAIEGQGYAISVVELLERVDALCGAECEGWRSW